MSGGYFVHWLIDNDTRWRVVHGSTPRRAVAACRRMRRDYFICGKDPGFVSLREQWKWTRLARRIAR